MLESSNLKAENYIIKAIKNLIIIIISIFIIITNSKKKFNDSDFVPEIYISPINKNFSELLPRINISDEDYVPTLKEIFSSRELYINEKNLTNEYIRFIRPIDENDEEIYQKELYPNLEFNELFKITRNDQYDVRDFYEICKNGRLIDNHIYEASDKPLVSFVLPSFNKENDLIKTVRSIQNQSFKNIEIIIMNDCSTDNSFSIFEYLLQTDPRIRVFHHLKNMGCWRSRLDGFLYSRGKYVQHFDTGDIFVDNYVVEDIYNYAVKYTLDSVRFSFQWVSFNNVSSDNFRKVFRKEYTKIKYGRTDYRLGIFGFGTIWNRLTRANVFSKGLDLVDEYVLNAYKNLWEDAWWNKLANLISFSTLVVNRVGYCYFPSFMGEGMLKVGSRKRQEKAIREFIYFWLFDYQALPKNDSKKVIIDEMRRFTDPENRVRGKIVLISYLKTEFPIYEHLLNTLLDDIYIEKDDKIFIHELLTNYTELKNTIKKKKNKKKKKKV